MRWQGVANLTKITNAKLDAYLDLLSRVEDGRALLTIRRGFERTPAKRQRYASVLSSGRYPVQIVWGEADPALKIRVDGKRASRCGWPRSDPPAAGRLSFEKARHLPRPI
jgi:hypothetical protein